MVDFKYLGSHRFYPRPIGVHLWSARNFQVKCIYVQYIEAVVVRNPPKTGGVGGLAFDCAANWTPVMWTVFDFSQFLMSFFCVIWLIISAIFMFMMTQVWVDLKQLLLVVFIIRETRDWFPLGANYQTILEKKICLLACLPVKCLLKKSRFLHMALFFLCFT